MNPLEVVARTPKNNCRECGYPSCLAFGAAVATIGLDPRRCPCINIESLVFSGERLAERLTSLITGTE